MIRNFGMAMMISTMIRLVMAAAATTMIQAMPVCTLETRMIPPIAMIGANSTMRSIIIMVI